MLFTFQDAVHHCLDFVGGENSPQGIRHARIACQSALRELHTSSMWHYLYTHGRLTTVEPFDDGTIAYDHTGGTYERQVTLTSGTWPSWAAYGTIVIDSIPYEVEARKSNTVITLTEITNPGEDVASGTTYNLYRDNFTLPANYKSGFTFEANLKWHGMEYVHPKNWIYNRSRTAGIESGTPLIYSVMGDSHLKNRLGIRMYPYPSEVLTYDYIYARKPDDLKIFEYKDGTIATTADSTTVNGTNVSWNSTMIGAVIRISATDTTTASGVTESGPFGFERNAYYVHETIIADVTDSDTLELVDAIPETLSGVRYVISSLVDIEGESMLLAYQRLLEKQMAIKMNMESKGEYVQLARQALILAREADARYSERRKIVGGENRYTREYDWHRPLGADVQ